MKKYDQYKNSGVEWLSEIPEHWESIRMKHLFRDYSEKNKANEELLSVTQNQGVVPRSWVENRMVMPSGALESFKFIQKGDFAISLRSFEGGLEYCHHDGIISPAYTVLKTKRKIIEKYYKYLFKSFSFISELQTSVVGIREGKNISYPELSYSFLPIPKIEEQSAIANFLDDKTAKIDQAIAIKQKQIELLKERRQILIHKAVTRGLDENVKLKDSGVEWIGEIPEHWEVKRLKYIATIVLGKMLCNEDKGNYKLKPYLKSKNIQWLNTDINSVDEMWFSEKEMLEYRLKKGDLILSEGGEVGKTCIWNNELAECYIQNSAHKVTVYNENISEYYLYIFFTIGKFGVFDSIVNRVSIGHLTKDKLSNIEIINPPKDEQQKIVEHIENLTIKIASAISLKEQEIEKMKEYKMSLVDSVVTGKVKVC